MNLNQNKCLNSKYDSEIGKTNKNWPQTGWLCMIEFHFFGKPIKTLGSLGKIRVGRVTGNTHIFFFCLTKPQGYKTCSMLNSTEHEIYPAHKC